MPHEYIQLFEAYAKFQFTKKKKRKKKRKNKHSM